MRDDNLCLSDILEYVGRIQDYHFFVSLKTKDAVARCFEIVGEATKRISRRLRDAHPEIPWRRMAGFRDVLIHDYPVVDWDEVWQIVERDLPILKQQLQMILRESAKIPRTRTRKKPSKDSSQSRKNL